MAISLVEQLPVVKRETLATANTAYVVELPDTVRSITVRFFDAAGTTSIGGKFATSDADYTAGNYWTVQAGETMELTFGARPSTASTFSVWVAGSANSAIVELFATSFGG